MKPRRIPLLLVLASALLGGAAIGEAAEISGRVTNGTTGQPVAGQFVNLLALRGMMVPVRETQTDGEGRYRFVVAAAPSERFLVQVPFRGVNYNAAAGFTSGERITADIEVFEPGAKPSEVQLHGHTIFLEPHQDHLRVTEFFSLHNQSQPPRSYAPEGGSFHFGVPETIGDLSVSVVTAAGMPLRQQAQPGESRNRFWIDYAIRPGATEIQVSYAVPLSGRSLALGLPLLVPTERRHLAVSRAGMRLEGKELSEIEQSQVPQARVYRVSTRAPGTLQVRLEVDPAALGTLESQASPESGAPAPAASESAVQIVPHPVNRNQWYILGLALFVLSMGLYYLSLVGQAPSSAGSPSPARAQPATPAGKSSRAQPT